MNNIFKKSKRLKNALKVFDIFLIFFTLATVFLFFIINFSKKEIKSSYYNTNYNISAGKVKKLNIRTDKKEYQKGENVKIYLNNFSNKNLIEDNNSSFLVSSLRYFGENYGVGLIEKKINNVWFAIEPVWRCKNKCYEQCKYQDVISSKEKKEFVWDQNLLYCDDLDKTEKREESSAGTYRISLASWDERKQDYSILYSNEFIIN